MKFLRLTFLVALIGCLTFFTSCDEGGGKKLSIEETQFLALSKTWTVTEVRFGSGNTDRTAEYTATGMTLTISGDFVDPTSAYQYTITGRPSLSPWPASGTWTFDPNDPETLIIRAEDNLPITYSVTETELQLTFNYTGAGYPARVSAVEGSWTFLFTAN
jgi:hypothetical protein